MDKECVYRLVCFSRSLSVVVSTLNLTSFTLQGEDIQKKIENLLQSNDNRINKFNVKEMIDVGFRIGFAVQNMPWKYTISSVDDVAALTVAMGSDTFQLNKVADELSDDTLKFRNKLDREFGKRAEIKLKELIKENLEINPNNPHLVDDVQEAMEQWHYNGFFTEHNAHVRAQTLQACADKAFGCAVVSTRIVYEVKSTSKSQQLIAQLFGDVFIEKKDDNAQYVYKKYMDVMTEHDKALRVLRFLVYGKGMEKGFKGGFTRYTLVPMSKIKVDEVGELSLDGVIKEQKTLRSRYPLDDTKYRGSLLRMLRRQIESAATGKKKKIGVMTPTDKDTEDTSGGYATWVALFVERVIMLSGKTFVFCFQDIMPSKHLLGSKEAVNEQTQIIDWIRNIVLPIKNNEHDVTQTRNIETCNEVMEKVNGFFDMDRFATSERLRKVCEEHDNCFSKAYESLDTRQTEERRAESLARTLLGYHALQCNEKEDKDLCEWRVTSACETFPDRCGIDSSSMKNGKEITEEVNRNAKTLCASMPYRKRVSEMSIDDDRRKYTDAMNIAQMLEEQRRRSATCNDIVNNACDPGQQANCLLRALRKEESPVREECMGYGNNIRDLLNEIKNQPICTQLHGVRINKKTSPELKSIVNSVMKLPDVGCEEVGNLPKNPSKDDFWDELDTFNTSYIINPQKFVQEKDTVKYLVAAAVVPHTTYVEMKESFKSKTVTSTDIKARFGTVLNFVDMQCVGMDVGPSGTSDAWNVRGRMLSKEFTDAMDECGASLAYKAMLAREYVEWIMCLANNVMESKQNDQYWKTAIDKCNEVLNEENKTLKESRKDMITLNSSVKRFVRENTYTFVSAMLRKATTTHNLYNAMLFAHRVDAVNTLMDQPSLMQTIEERIKRVTEFGGNDARKEAENHIPKEDGTSNINTSVLHKIENKYMTTDDLRNWWREFVMATLFATTTDLAKAFAEKSLNVLEKIDSIEVLYTILLCTQQANEGVANAIQNKVYTRLSQKFTKHTANDLFNTIISLNDSVEQREVLLIPCTDLSIPEWMNHLSETQNIPPQYIPMYLSQNFRFKENNRNKRIQEITRKKQNWNVAMGELGIASDRVRVPGRIEMSVDRAKNKLTSWLYPSKFASFISKVKNAGKDYLKNLENEFGLDQGKIDQIKQVWEYIYKKMSGNNADDPKINDTILFVNELQMKMFNKYSKEDKIYYLLSCDIALSRLLYDNGVIDQSIIKKELTTAYNMYYNSEKEKNIHFRAVTYEDLLPSSICDNNSSITFNELKKHTIATCAVLSEHIRLSENQSFDSIVEFYYFSVFGYTDNVDSIQHRMDVFAGLHMDLKNIKDGESLFVSEE